MIRLHSYVSVRLVCFRIESHGKTRVNLTVFSSCYNYCSRLFFLNSSVGSAFGVHFFDVTNAEVYGFEPESSLITILRLVFSGYCFYMLFFFFEIFISFRIFILFYTKHENNHRSSSLGSD